jgi:glycerophosphoryl diester phosphodiesterase
MRAWPVSAPRWIVERPIAHRGLHGDGRPENSLAAFTAAAFAGYPIELDVHRTADDRIAVFHDDTLERMTGAAGRVQETPWAHLAALRLAGTDERVPELVDVLAAIDGRVPLLVELKGGGREGRIERLVVDAVRDYRGEVAIQSFDPLGLVHVRMAAPHVPRGLLACDFADESLSWPKKFLLRRLALAPIAAPSFIAYDLHALPYWAPTLARRLGLPLVAWTVRTPEELLSARALADNVIFEHVRP